jgi:regulatory protein
MKIEKFLPAEETQSAKRLVITKITTAVKTKGRYNIFVDEKYAFSLDELQLVDLGLKKGRELTADELENLKNEGDFGKNYIRAVDLISRRLRSEREIRDYAFRHQWTPANRDRVIARLHDRGYLNDEKFADSFARSRARQKNLSRRQMELELLKKGIDKNIIARVLNTADFYDEQQALRDLIAKKRPRYETDEKLMQYLARQGFGFDDIKKALASEQA